MCSLHAVTLLCLSLTHYDILIEDLVLRKTPAEAGVTFLKSDIIRRRFTYFSCFFSFTLVLQFHLSNALHACAR